MTRTQLERERERERKDQQFNSLVWDLLKLTPIRIRLYTSLYMALVPSCTHRSACVALISRCEHTCSAAGECLAETAEEGGAEASTATEGQI